MVVRKYLLDTNIFLEVLLLQAKQKSCKDFITNHFTEISITQFSLNSVGIACYRNKCIDVFTSFLNDIASSIPVITLNIAQLLFLERVMKNEALDYDDSYQLITAQANDLEIVTLDTDLKKIQNLIKVHFL
jgi:predicted nucleic acid-binding protein